MAEAKLQDLETGEINQPANAKPSNLCLWMLASVLANIGVVLCVLSVTPHEDVPQTSKEELVESIIGYVLLGSNISAGYLIARRTYVPNPKYNAYLRQNGWQVVMLGVMSFISLVFFGLMRSFFPDGTAPLPWKT